MTYELYDQITMAFFYRNKRIMYDIGTGSHDKLKWAREEDEQELIDLIETIYKGAKKGRNLVISPKGERSLL
jgi:DIM1 family U5 snRNP protein